VVYSSKYPIFSVTVDVVCLTVRDDAFQVLLVERGEEPFKGQLALPGGFVKIDEDLEDAARRELKEETAVSAPAHVEQLATYGAPHRDPRSRVVSVAFLAVAPGFGEATGGSDAASASWHPVGDVQGTLAFDHDVILGDAIERARGKLEYSALATEFCPPEFTIPQLRRVYEIIWGVELDPANFHRKVTKGARGLLVESSATTTGSRGRPAQLYRAGGLQRIHPPLDLRPPSDPTT
jgi:8-oxo-dGTP diphosphatase